MSTFEINIRFVGGLLALHTLTKDKLFLDKAVEVANSFLHVFNTHTGLPMSLFNPVRYVGNVLFAALFILME